MSAGLAPDLSSHGRPTLPWAGGLTRRTAVLGSGTAAIAVSVLPDPSRPVLTLAVLGLAGCVLAAVTGRVVAGTLAVATVTLTALLAGALDESSLRPVQLLATSALLLLLLEALGAAEAGRDTGRRTGIGAALGATSTTATGLQPRGGRLRRTWPHLLALSAAAGIAVTAAQDVVPSVPLVLAGLAAAVSALGIAVSAHRSGQP